METIPNNHGLDLVKTKAYLTSKRGQRRYNFGAVFTLPNPATLPPRFMHNPLEIKDQGSTDMCLAHALASMSELQEGVLLDPYFTFMKMKEIMGDWRGFGADPESGMKAAKQGFLAKSQAPYTLDRGRDFLANPMNWDPKYNDLAAPHAKQAGFWVEPTKKIDFFDAIRGAIWLFRQEKRSVVIGVPYASEWVEKTLITEPGSDGGGHAENVLGWEDWGGVPYLGVQNSYGIDIGKEGIQYFSRRVVNELFVFGLMFADMPEGMTHEDITRISRDSRLTFLQKVLAEIIRTFNAWRATQPQ